jgi:hypothetical protein
MATDELTKSSEGKIEGIDPVELEEWYDSLEDVLHRYGPDRTQQLLVNLRERAYLRGVMMPFLATTPYINTIPVSDQPRLSGQHRDRTADQVDHPLECDGDGRPGQQEENRRSGRRAHLDLRLLGDAV